MEIRAVSLDLFDTLVDLVMDASRGAYPTGGDLHRAVSEHADVSFEDFLARLREADRTLREERVAHGLEVPTPVRFGLLAERLGIPDPALPERLTDIHMGAIRRSVRVPSHHAHLLRTLGRRVRVGLCSNFTHGPTARRILVDGSFDGALETVVISEEVGVRKPRREIFEAVLSGLEEEAAATLHVGDDLRADVAGAAALGMRTAWITRRIEDAERRLADYDGPRPDFVIRDLAELEALLARDRS